MAGPQEGMLHAAMGLVKEAIQLDSLDKTQDAYIQYLESVAYISQGLLTEAKDHTAGPANAKNTKRLLQLAQQCVERALTVADRMQEGAPALPTAGDNSLQATPVMGTSAAPDNQSLPPATPGNHSLPPATPGNQSLPLAAPGNQALPPAAPGNQSLPPAAPGNQSLPPAAPGNQSLPPVASGNYSLPPVAPGNQALPPAALGNQALPPATPGNHALPPAAPGNQSLPPASGAARTVPFQGNLRSTLPTSPASPRRMAPTPLEKAYQDNQKLMAAYQARMARLRGRRDKGQLNLSLQRRMIENMAIARAKQEALKKKMEERHRQYQEEAVRQFISVDGLPLPENQCQELYAQIKEFEDQELWLKAWRAKLAEHPSDSKLIEELVKQVLRCQEHPITKKMQQFQLKLYDRLNPLVVKLQQEPEKVTVPYIEDLSDLEHCGARSTEQVSPSQEDKESSITENKSDSDEGLVQSQIDMSGDQIVDVSSAGDQTSLDEQNPLDESLEKTVDETATENTGDFSDTVRAVRDDVKSAIDKGEELVNKLKAESKASRRDSENTLAYLQNNMDDMFEDLTEECAEEPGNETGNNNQSQAETGTEKQEEEEQEILKMTEDAVQKHLVQVVKDIREFMDHLLAMLIVGYRELNSVAGRDQCLATMEEPFFTPIWSCVGALFRYNIWSTKFFKHHFPCRQADHKKEVVLARAMTRYNHALPEELGVPERLCAPGVGGTVLYKPAVNELRNVTSCNNPVSKLECIVRTCRAVCECADTSAGEAQKTAASIGADDLLPLLSYVILQSELPQLMSECHCMEVFIREGFLLGEEGYCLTTLQTALDYVASLAKS
ncbi:VPS9 domain-containing protein 1-like [Branchiostoma floridae]|uniref:VPS9 domain-containing protein 1-like n=1 Tax=Branchiostoma floridae TaxID=7739 RepID=A0A9J7LBT2_BRAFL|nr:VPS9 domain-containing protein 1-like [Branchiostoma floridae]